LQEGKTKLRTINGHSVRLMRLLFLLAEHSTRCWERACRSDEHQELSVDSLLLSLSSVASQELADAACRSLSLCKVIIRQRDEESLYSILVAGNERRPLPVQALTLYAC